MHTTYRDLKFLKYGNKPGKLLSYLTKGAYTPICIPKINIGYGKTSTDLGVISTLLEKFYENLYSPQEDREEAAEKFLGSVYLPTLTDIYLDTLNLQLTKQELHGGYKGSEQRQSSRPR